MSENAEAATTVTFLTTCPLCRKPNQIEVPMEVMNKLQQGAFVQIAWPDATSADREVLISGAHAECWEQFMQDEEDASS